MPVNDPTLLNAYAQMGRQAYESLQGDTQNVPLGNSNYFGIGQEISQQLNEVVFDL